MTQNEILKSRRGARYAPAPLVGLDDGSRAGATVLEAANDAVAKVERSIAYMAEHINQPLQVATLAALANVSPSHFFALFKQRTGCPPMDYFTRLRMRHACRLLDSTPASVKEVAAALGYDDPFYFSRVFKAVNNVPPSQYRGAQTNYGEGAEHYSRSHTLSASNVLRA